MRRGNFFYAILGYFKIYGIYKWRLKDLVRLKRRHGDVKSIKSLYGILHWRLATRQKKAGGSPCSVSRNFRLWWILPAQTHERRPFL